MNETAVSSAFAIGPMTRSDLDLAVNWAAAEGWNPGLHDAEVFWTTDSGGFLAGKLEGRMIGCISAVRYGGSYGFIGFYLVSPEYRGQGYGLKIWNRAMEQLAGRTIGLDGVVAQQANYQKSGFELAFRNARYEGVGGGRSPEGLIDLAGIPFDRILAYDDQCFPVSRPEFLSPWLAMPGASGKGVFSRGVLKGYGVLRPCRNGFKIGPLFADDQLTADLIFQGLAAEAPGRPIFLDVPGNNPQALALARDHGLEVVFETARMYLNGPPEWAANKVFGLTTFELG